MSILERNWAMEIVRTVEGYDLIYDSSIGKFKIVKTELSEISMWFDSEIAEGFKKMNEEDFISSAKEYIHQARYVD